MRSTAESAIRKWHSKGEWGKEQDFTPQPNIKSNPPLQPLTLTASLLAIYRPLFTSPLSPHLLTRANHHAKITKTGTQANPPPLFFRLLARYTRFQNITKRVDYKNMHLLDSGCVVAWDNDIVVSKSPHLSPIAPAQCHAHTA